LSKKDILRELNGICVWLEKARAALERRRRNDTERQERRGAGRPKAGKEIARQAAGQLPATYTATLASAGIEEPTARRWQTMAQMNETTGPAAARGAH